MDVAARFSSVGELAAAIAAMAGSILLAFWRRPLPFVPEDVRRAGAFQIARLAVSFVVVVLVFAGSRYLAENWVWFALGSVILAGLGFLLTYWICMAKVYAYRPNTKAALKRVVGGKLTEEAAAIKAERKKTVVNLLEESGDNPELVFEKASVAVNQLVIILGVLLTMTGGGVALGTLAAISATADKQPGQSRPKTARPYVSSLADVANPAASLKIATVAK